MFGTTISTRRPTSSTCMSAGSGKRSTSSSSARCCTPYAGLVIACAPGINDDYTRDTLCKEPTFGPYLWRRTLLLLHAAPVTIAEKPRRPAARPWPSLTALLHRAQRFVRTHAFRLAGLYFAVFVLSVLGVLFFVYWTSADFVERQTETTLDAEISGLAEQYAQRGLSGLVQIVAARSAGDRGDGMLYLVATAEGRPLAGNISGWPGGAPATAGLAPFQIEVPGKRGEESHPARAKLFVIPDGYRLLVGRDIGDAEIGRAHV